MLFKLPAAAPRLMLLGAALAPRPRRALGDQADQANGARHGVVVNGW